MAFMLTRIIKTQESLGYRIFKGKGEVNIVYVEGISLNGAMNTDRINEWNDVRLIYRFDEDEPKLLGSWLATTEPGFFYTQQPLNPGGAFRIAFGQYQAWQVGFHGSSARTRHEALVQTSPVRGHRDRNKDGFRTNDSIVEGLFGINQHHGWDMPRVDRASAGCLVGQSVSGHEAFMRIVKSDPRYIQNRKYIFWTTILNGSKLEE